MKTVTFYSYKGGVGRTLLLANVARYLSRFGQRVFAIDFDLEAPGLHYKLSLRDAAAPLEIRLGLVDYIHSFSAGDRVPEDLREFVLEVDRWEGTGGSIHLMPAGNVLSAQYWKKLAQIDWHKLFYADDAKGIPFFLNLRNQIEKEFTPDYLLVDSRTGITEVGGVATTILPEVVVCILLHNRENLEGAREVLRSINRTLRARGQASVAILPVVARLPVLKGDAREAQVLGEMMQFLNQDAPDIEDTLSISSLAVLHTDRRLELEETLLVDGHRSIDQSPLLRDYIRLFAQLIPPDVLAPQIGPLVKEAMQRAWDDPAGAERDLVALTEYCAHAEPFEALLKLYRLRNVERLKILRVAARYWELTGITDNPLLWSTIRDNFDEKILDEKATIPLEFVEAVWANEGGNDPKVGIDVAKGYLKGERPDKVLRVVIRICDQPELPLEIVVECLRLLRMAGDFTRGFALLNRYKDAYGGEDAFRSAWLSLAGRSGDRQRALELVDTEMVTATSCAVSDLPLCIKLYVVAGKSKELRDALGERLRHGLAQELHRGFRQNGPSGVSNIIQAFREVGFGKELRGRLKQVMDADEYEYFMRHTTLGQRDLFGDEE